MASKLMTSRKVDTAKPGKYGDGEGLQLVVSASGARKWVLRFTLNGVSGNEMGLGSARGDNLAKARTEAARWRELARSGTDPRQVRKKEKTAKETAARVRSFTAIAAEYIRTHRRGWKNRKHARQWVSTLKTYARPVIGRVPVDEIDTEHVLAILKPIWLTRTETAKRLQGRIENVLDFAAAQQWRGPVNPARWRGHLDKLLAAPGKVRKVRHHPAMPYAELPAFLSDLRAREGTAARALEFLILTACRSGEVLGATWAEIELAGRTWTIPPERMKAGREHRVPLSDAAIAVLEPLPRIAGCDYVFPGARHGRPLSNMSLLKQMRGMGYGVGGTRGDCVPHGLRSSFRDWAEETTGFPARVCEAALAHTVGDKTVAAYQRGDLFAKRCEMMQRWSDFLAKAPGQVVTLGKVTQRRIR